MKHFNLTLDIPLSKDPNYGLIFTKFLPREKEAIKLKQKGFDVLIFFSYNKKDLNDLSTDFIHQQKKIKHHSNISINSLKFKLEKSISNKLYDKLGNEILDDDTTIFCNGIMEIIVSNYKKLYEYARNKKHQVWLKEFDYDSEKFQNIFSKTNAIWDYNNQKKYLYFKGKSLHVTLTIDRNTEKFISKKSWDRLEKFLKNDDKIKIEELFIANSIEHLKNGNFRMAILEIVIAFEHYIKSNKCKNIKHFLTEKELSYLTKLFKKNHLSIPAEIILDKIDKKLIKKDINQELILKTIELRNDIMHNGHKKQIEMKLANEYVKNMIKFINFVKFNGRKK